MQLEDLITEKQLCEELGCKPQHITRLRNQGLAFISLGVGVRLYRVQDVADILESKIRRIGTRQINKNTAAEK